MLGCTPSRVLFRSSRKLRQPCGILICDVNKQFVNTSELHVVQKCFQRSLLIEQVARNYRTLMLRRLITYARLFLVSDTVVLIFASVPGRFQIESRHSYTGTNVYVERQRKQLLRCGLRISFWNGSTTAAVQSPQLQTATPCPCSPLAKLP